MKGSTSLLPLGFIAFHSFNASTQASITPQLLMPLSTLVLHKWSCHDFTLIEGHNSYVIYIHYLHTLYDHSRSLQYSSQRTLIMFARVAALCCQHCTMVLITECRNSRKHSQSSLATLQPLVRDCQ